MKKNDFIAITVLSGLIISFLYFYFFEQKIGKDTVKTKIQSFNYEDFIEHPALDSDVISNLFGADFNFIIENEKIEQPSFHYSYISLTYSRLLKLKEEKESKFFYSPKVSCFKFNDEYLNEKCIVKEVVAYYKNNYNVPEVKSHFFIANEFLNQLKNDNIEFKLTHEQPLFNMIYPKQKIEMNEKEDTFTAYEIKNQVEALTNETTPYDFLINYKEHTKENQSIFKFTTTKTNIHTKEETTEENKSFYYKHFTPKISLAHDIQIIFYEKYAEIELNVDSKDLLNEEKLKNHLNSLIQGKLKTKDIITIGEKYGQ